MQDFATIRVFGEPAPQGSKTAVVRGKKAVMIEGGSQKGRDKHKNWRQYVHAAAVDYLEGGGQIVPEKTPVAASVIFFLSKGVSLPKYLRWVRTKPDLDKLIRSTMDGIAPLLPHDSRVAGYERVYKLYAGPDTAPGAIIKLYLLDEDDAPAMPAELLATALPRLTQLELL